MAERRFVWAFTLAAVGVLMQPVFSQGRGGAPPAGGGTVTGGGTSTPTIGTGNTPTSIPNSPSNTPSTTNPQSSGFPQPIPITGRVLLEDGTAPTESVTIERVCNGNPRAEGFTDSKGYFFIELGSRNNTAALQDASEVSGGMGSMNPNRMGTGMGMGTTNQSGAMGATDSRLMNCDLRARLAGYRSQTVNLANHRAMDNPDIGTILLHRLGPSEGNTVSTSALEIPRDARKAFDKAQESSKKGKLDDALKNYSKAVELYRPYAAAWFELGKLQMVGGDVYTARGSFNESIKADPRYLPAYVAVADLDLRDKKWKEAAEVTDRAGKLDAFDYPQVYFYNSVANYNLKNVDAAEKSARQAERLDTRHLYPQIYYLLGNILAIHHDYPGAAENLRTFLKLAPDSEDAVTARKQLEQAERISASVPAQKPDR